MEKRVPYKNHIMFKIEAYKEDLLYNARIYTVMLFLEKWNCYKLEAKDLVYNRRFYYNLLWIVRQDLNEKFDWDNEEDLDYLIQSVYDYIYEITCIYN